LRVLTTWRGKRPRDIITRIRTCQSSLRKCY
jgi:hypothetical protein